MALDKAVDRLRAKFPGKSPSWIRRAILRLGSVKELGENLYLVKGKRELGDWRPFYYVWHDGKQWLCDCFFSQFGVFRQRQICTHIAAVLLHRQYKHVVEKMGSKTVYVAEDEVECRERLEVNGEYFLKPAAERADLTFYASPKYRIFVISERRRIVVKCSGYVILEAEGEPVPYATALAMLEEFKNS
ncbi:MAG: hypothetical protein QXI07_11390 [Pyrobaculum sp.]